MRAAFLRLRGRTDLNRQQMPDDVHGAGAAKRGAVRAGSRDREVDEEGHKKQCTQKKRKMHKRSQATNDADPIVHTASGINKSGGQRSNSLRPRARRNYVEYSDESSESEDLLLTSESEDAESRILQGVPPSSSPTLCATPSRWPAPRRLPRRRAANLGLQCAR